MRLYTRALLLAISWQLLAEPLQAQDSGSPCPAVYPAPRVGDYARMMFTNEAGESMLIRFAIVGQDDVQGKPHYWMEVVYAPPEIGDDVIAQMLVPYYPFENEDIRGYVVQMPGQPPQRVPLRMLEALGANTSPGPGWQEQCASAEDLGLERVTVAAGTFRARHYRSAEDDAGDVWIADVPFGIVKFVTASGRMQLVEHGSDAKSSITEEPIEIELPPGGL
jgi:hypothetical protein